MKPNKVIIGIISLALFITACTTAKITPATPTSPATTNYVVAPNLITALETAHAVNAATAAVDPFSPAVEIGLGAIAALATWVAKRKNDKASQQALMLKTVIQGVENADNAEVKTAIQTQATAVGVEGALGTTVQGVNSGLL